MDFEETESNLLILDIGLTVLAVCKTKTGLEIEQSLVEPVLRGYEQVRPLEKAEKSFLKTAIKYVGGAGSLWLQAHNESRLASQYLSRALSLDKWSP